MAKLPEGSRNPQESDARWRPERLSEARLEALLPYTEFESVEQFSTAINQLAGILAFLPRRDGRNKFISRSGGPTRREYVLYAGRLPANQFKAVATFLEQLGVDFAEMDLLEREYVVSTQRGKTTLELIGLVAGYDPDADETEMQGQNWQTVMRSAMEDAAKEDAADDIVVRRGIRSFPLKGSSKTQPLNPELRKHFMESVDVEAAEMDPVELDKLIDDTAVRFEEGSIDLDQAFKEWGIDVEEESENKMPTIPEGKLGEELRGHLSREYRWRKGSLYAKDASGTFNEPISSEALLDLYRKAGPAARLLWEADTMSRKAERMDAAQNSEKSAEDLRRGAEEKRKLADTMKESLDAIHKVIEIHSGFVFTRVMRFLKRRDVRAASAYGPKDLMQEGMLGVYRALARFDADVDERFLGFAKYHIDGRMLGFATRHRTFVTIPSHMQTALHQMQDIDEQVDHISVDSEGVSTSMSAPERARRRIQLATAIFGDRYNMGLFLDRKKREVFADDAVTRIPVSDLEDVDATERDMSGEPVSVAPYTRIPEVIDTKRYLSRLLTEVLTPREERLIRYRYHIGSEIALDAQEEQTLEMAGHIIGGVGGGTVTRETIRQMELKAFRKLKRAIVLRLGTRDSTGSKYIDMQRLAAFFDVSDM